MAEPTMKQALDELAECVDRISEAIAVRNQWREKYGDRRSGDDDLQDAVVLLAIVVSMLAERDPRTNHDIDL